MDLNLQFEEPLIIEEKYSYRKHRELVNDAVFCAKLEGKSLVADKGLYDKYGQYRMGIIAMGLKGGLRWFRPYKN